MEGAFDAGAVVVAEGANGFDDVADLLQEDDSGFGCLTAVRHAAELSETPAYWSRPSMPLGSHPPEWPG